MQQLGGDDIDQLFCLCDVGKLTKYLGTAKLGSYVMSQDWKREENAMLGIYEEEPKVDLDVPKVHGRHRLHQSSQGVTSEFSLLHTNSIISMQECCKRHDALTRERPANLDQQSEAK